MRRKGVNMMPFLLAKTNNKMSFEEFQYSVLEVAAGMSMDSDVRQSILKAMTMEPSNSSFEWLIHSAYEQYLLRCE